MGQWTQFDEDAARLPEGMKRTGYDADTARYRFCDREGNTYLGPPHEDYGSLTFVGRSTNPPTHKDDRPQAFASGASYNLAPTFHDFLPSHVITSPSSAESTLSDAGEATAGSRLRDAVRRATVPAMQNVAKNVRRSATMGKSREKDQEKTGLLRSISRASSKLTRSKTSATTSTLVSVDEPGVRR
ncbi:hypothetical protein B0H15DRAFT_793921 [Mycena belliarum]|uniref:Uncharacterized protein n=1 Tax=Mycena belliarum TaxID=1033014 RepID=A0AAD6TNQ8_9AGAR|nr:hypothetical protein B0H15DRAFT_793921 [Mycena belliae]